MPDLTVQVRVFGLILMKLNAYKKDHLGVRFVIWMKSLLQQHIIATILAMILDTTLALVVPVQNVILLVDIVEVQMIVETVTSATEQPISSKTQL